MFKVNHQLIFSHFIATFCIELPCMSHRRERVRMQGMMYSCSSGLLCLFYPRRSCILVVTDRMYHIKSYPELLQYLLRREPWGSSDSQDGWAETTGRSCRAPHLFHSVKTYKDRKIHCCSQHCTPQTSCRFLGREKRTDLFPLPCVCIYHELFTHKPHQAPSPGPGSPGWFPLHCLRGRAMKLPGVKLQGLSI